MQAVGLRRMKLNRIGMVALALGLAGITTIGIILLDRPAGERDALESQLAGAPGDSVSTYVMRSADDIDWSRESPRGQPAYVMRAQDDIDWPPVANATEPAYVMRAQDDIAWPQQPVSISTPYTMVAEDDIEWPPVR